MGVCVWLPGTSAPAPPSRCSFATACAFVGYDNILYYTPPSDPRRKQPGNFQSIHKKLKP